MFILTRTVNIRKDLKTLGNICLDTDARPVLCVSFFSFNQSLADKYEQNISKIKDRLNLLKTGLKA